MLTVVDPLRFQLELVTHARKRGLIPRLVSAQPEQWRMGPLTLHVDRRRKRAELRYARAQVVSQIPLRGSSVLSAWQRARTTLLRGSLAPDALLPRLGRIYHRMLAQSGRPAGDRVPLGELVTRLRRSVRGYSRAQVAFDLMRLRHERRLRIDGLRIDLSVATGMAVSDPRRVVWIEDEWGSGQYYLYFRIVGESNVRADAESGPKDPQSDGRKREAARSGRHPHQRRQ